MEFTRGDINYHTFTMPASVWSAGGKLFFAAKPAVDDDNTDAASLINGVFDDTDVTDVTINGIAMKKYTCTFLPAATNSILSQGADEVDLLGEFQFVPTSNNPQTYPGNNEKIAVKLWPDIKRKII